MQNAVKLTLQFLKEHRVPIDKLMPNNASCTMSSCYIPFTDEYDALTERDVEDVVTVLERNFGPPKITRSGGPKKTTWLWHSGDRQIEVVCRVYAADHIDAGVTLRNL